MNQLMNEVYNIYLDNNHRYYSLSTNCGLAIELSPYHH